MKKWIYNALIILFAAVFLISGGFLAYYFIDSRLQQDRYSQLSHMMEPVTPRPVIETEDTPEVTEPTAPQYTQVTDPETGAAVLLLPEFKELYLLNNDIVGWIRIPGTNIDYPVMQTPEAPDYYLKRNFDKEHSSRGCIYAREVCDVFTPSDNITLYGHRMKDGTMFGQLDKYTSESFYEENPYIYFDTLTELRTYRIMAVFRTTASQGEGFGYHLFVDAESEEAFTEFYSTCKALSIYDTGVEAAPGDSFITLSTCEYSQVNGRLVIVAKREG